MGGGELDHFARPHEQDADLPQVLEQLRCQTHRRSSHADAVRANLGAAAHFLGNGEAALEQLVERGAEAAGRLGGPHGILHLPQYLGLAQHHAVESTGHAEGVAGRRVVLQRVGVVAQGMHGHTASLGEPVERVIHVHTVARAVHLGAVAGRENGRFRMVGKSLP